MLISLISLCWAGWSGKLYSPDYILNGKSKDRLPAAEFSPSAFATQWPMVAQAFDQQKPDAKFQKALRLTSLHAVWRMGADCLVYTHTRLLEGKSPFPGSTDTLYRGKAGLFKAEVKPGTSWIWARETAQGWQPDSAGPAFRLTREAQALQRYYTLPLPNSPDALLSRMLNDEQPLIATKDTLFERKADGSVIMSTETVPADGLFPMVRWVVTDIWLPLLGVMMLLTGLMGLLEVSRAGDKLAKILSPFFRRLFPSLRDGHPAFNFMTLNFAANFLGLDNAATPFGLKAMEQLQAENPNPERASDPQIMFLCLHAAGLTLIPTSIIGYRAVMNAANPTDVMVPIILTSFTGTLAALLLVAWRQKLQLMKAAVLVPLAALVAALSGVLVWLQSLEMLEKARMSSILGVGLFLLIFGLIIAYSQYKEKLFREAGTNVFASFVEGAKGGWETALRILPYMVGMMAAISLFRNSGIMPILVQGLSSVLSYIGVGEAVTQALPVALLRPFSAGGARGFMFDAMRNFGPDSFTGRLACLFEGAAETTFYVIALYYGSVQVKDTRYTLAIMLLVDLICVITAIAVAGVFF